jgi:hypothetical protein
MFRPWFNFNAKAATPLENCIRQITNMSEDEFLEVVDESLLPTANTRFQRSSVTFLKDFTLSAIPPSVYEWFEEFIGSTNSLRSQEIYRPLQVCGAP